MILSRTVCVGSLLWLGSLLPQAAMAALEVHSDATLAEIYTDNVDLATSDLKEDEWVTRLAPRVLLTYDGPALDWATNYTFEALFYSNDSARNESYNQLDSRALLDLIGTTLQLEGTAFINQVNVLPERPVISSNIYSTGNLTDVTRWNLGPRWRQDVFGGSEVDGYASFGLINYDDPELQDINSINGRFSLHSDPRLHPVLGYDLVYEYNKLDYEVSGDAVVQTAFLQLGYRTSSATQLIVLGGLDNDIWDRTSDSLSEFRWEAGFVSEIGASRLRATLGHRYYGSTYNFQWTLEQSDANYRLSYSETPVTSDLTAISAIRVTPGPGVPVPGAVPPLTVPDADLSRPGNPMRYVLRRGDALGSWHLFRSEVTLGLFWENRRDQVLVGAIESVNLALQSEESYGIDLGMRWETGPRSVVILEGDWRHREYNNLAAVGCDPFHPDPLICTSPARDGDQLKRLMAGFEYSLGPKTALAFRLRWQQRSGTASSSGDYDELSGTIQLMRRFF